MSTSAVLPATLPPLERRFPLDAMQRALPQPLPLSSVAMPRALKRLVAGKPLVVTALGMSNTVMRGGCFGAGCAAGGPQGKTQYAFGAQWMEWINQTWPHPGHALHNRARGASNPLRATSCLGSHVAPDTDVLLVDFQLSRWSALEQEYFARTVARLPRRPLAVFIGLVDWCASTGAGDDELPTRSNGNSSDTCARRLSRGELVSADPIGNRLARIARHYGQVFLAVHAALAPLMRARANARDWVPDGQHGPMHKRSIYYDSLAAMLVHLFRSGFETLRRQGGVVGAPNDGIETAAAKLRRMPPLLRPEAEVRPTLACYGWFHASLREPMSLRNVSGIGASGSGWFASRFTIHGERREKPGLVSLVGGDTVELEVAVRRGAGACIGITYLTSYEHMGVANVECMPPCSCTTMRIDALQARQRLSLFRGVELPASSPVPTCILRFTNLGVARKTAQAQESKFRLVGLHSSEQLHMQNGSIGAEGACMREERKYADRGALMGLYGDFSSTPCKDRGGCVD